MVLYACIVRDRLYLPDSWLDYACHTFVMFCIGSGLPLVDGPLPPFPYRPGVLRVMAVGIEPEAMPEARLPCEVLFGHASNVVDESAVRFIQLPQYIRERKAPFLFRHLRIEGINAAVLDLSWGPASCDDERQVLQRLLLP